MDTTYRLEKQIKSKKGNLTDKYLCSNEFSCVWYFSKKERKEKKSAET